MIQYRHYLNDMMFDVINDLHSLSLYRRTTKHLDPIRDMIELYYSVSHETI